MSKDWIKFYAWYLFLGGVGLYEVLYMDVFFTLIVNIALVVSIALVGASEFVLLSELEKVAVRSKELTVKMSKTRSFAEVLNCEEEEIELNKAFKETNRFFPYLTLTRATITLIVIYIFISEKGLLWF